MLKLTSLLIFSENPKKLADFYKKVLDKAEEWQDGDWYGYDLGGIYLSFGPHDKVHGKNSSPERIMFNLDTDDVKGEFERIKKTGAKVIAEPYSMGGEEYWIATFEDPDGNYFQLVTPWKPEKK